MTPPAEDIASQAAKPLLESLHPTVDTTSSSDSEMVKVNNTSDDRVAEDTGKLCVWRLMLCSVMKKIYIASEFSL